MMHCILILILTERQQFTKLVKGNMLAALPASISTTLHIMRAKSKYLLIVNTAKPRYRNTPVSGREEGRERREGGREGGREGREGGREGGRGRK